jgi:hypothetical protein
MKILRVRETLLRTWRRLLVGSLVFLFAGAVSAGLCEALWGVKLPWHVILGIAYTGLSLSWLAYSLAYGVSCYCALHARGLRLRGRIFELGLNGVPALIGLACFVGIGIFAIRELAKTQ